LAVTQGVYVGDNGDLYAMSDARKHAVADGFNCVVYTDTEKVEF